MVSYNSAYDAPPFAQLLTLGRPKAFPFDSNRYERLGFTDEHVPTLIQLATDDALLWNWDDKSPNLFYAPIHAWRVLGKLRPDAAIQPLIALFEKDDEDNSQDSVLEDLPDVVSQFGAAAIPALSVLLNKPKANFWSLITASTILVDIALRDPATRSHCVEAITNRLRSFKRNDHELNGSLIADLCELQAVESAAVIKSAFYHKTVDLMVDGDWFDVKAELGLEPDAFVPGPEPKPNNELDLLLDEDDLPPLEAFDTLPLATGDIPYHPRVFDLVRSITEEAPLANNEDDALDVTLLGSGKKSGQKKKAKRKQAKQSRKQNRKKKK